jgi:hypothetical protein
LYDEADVTLDSEGLFRSVINDGFEPGGGRMIRDPKNNRQVFQSAYFALLVAGNNVVLADDSYSRSIELMLTPANAGEIEVEHPWDRPTTAGLIGARLREWSSDPQTMAAALRARDIIGGFGRDADRWRPLLQVAHAADATGTFGWFEITQSIMLEEIRQRKATETNAVNAHIAFLRDLNGVWPNGWDFMPTAEIVKVLADHDARQWGQGGRFGPINGEKIGHWIRQAATGIPGFEVATVKGIDPVGGGRVNGRKRADLAVLWHKHGIALASVELSSRAA